MLRYAVAGRRLEITAAGTIEAAASLAFWQQIRRDASVPEGLGLLLDVRQHDTDAVPLPEVQTRTARMAETLGPKIGPFWAIVIDEHLDQLAKGRLVQDMTQTEKVVMLFHDISEAREWLDSVAGRTPERT